MVFGTRRLGSVQGALRIAVAGALAIGVAAERVAADLIPPGDTRIDVDVRMDWGVLKDQLARPLVPRADDTWESIAQREVGDARWASTLRAMNGRETPTSATTPVWLPPKGLAFGPEATWWSAYVDSSKFGIDSDVSRTGFERVDPAAPTIDVFGTVTFLVRRHAGPGDVANPIESRELSEREIIANPKAAGVAVAPSFDVPMSGPEGRPLRRIEQAWRVEGVSGDVLRLALVHEARFDAEGRPISDRVVDVSAGAWIAVLLGVGVLVLVALLARRARASRPVRPA